MGMRGGASLALGFGLMRAVTSNAYITAFGTALESSRGFVATTEFTLLGNGFSVAMAVALVAGILLGSRRGARGAGPAAGRMPRLSRGLVGGAVLLLVGGYIAGAAGLLVALPAVWGAALCALVYAAGMVALTLAWFELFAALADVSVAVRSLVWGYLVQAAAYVVLSYARGWVLVVLCAALLGASAALMLAARKGLGAGASSGPEAFSPAVDGSGPLRTLFVEMRGLFGSFVCVFTLTAVVGFLHTSVIGNDFEYVVGAVPMSEALVLATVLLALVVLVSRRVPQASTVYRILFPVMLVALSVLPFMSGVLGSFSGMVMVVCYDLVGMAFVLFLVEVSHSCSTPAAALMGVYQAGTQASLVAGLLLGIALNRVGAGADASYTTVLILACIYLLSMVLAVLLRKRGATPFDLDAPDAPAPDGRGAPGAEAAVAAAGRSEQQAVRERVGERVGRYAIERGLTPREAQVMVQLARGRSAAAIAADLGMAENTAWAHIKRIYSKLGVHGKQELIDLIERDVIAGALGEK